MKEKFDGLMEHLLERQYFPAGSDRDPGTKHDQAGAGAERAATSAPPASSSAFTAIRCSEKCVEYGIGNGRPRAPQARYARGAGRRKRRSPARPEQSMELLIFDLDGTLIDSRLDLANAVNATRRHMGMEPLANERVYSYVGNGAPVLIRRALGEQATEAEVQEALEYFLEYYREHDLDYTVLYPGVKESLDRLRAAGQADGGADQQAGADEPHDRRRARASAGTSSRSTAATVSNSRSRIRSAWRR